MRCPAFQRLEEFIEGVLRAPTDLAGEIVTFYPGQLACINEQIQAIQQFLFDLLCSDAADIVIQRHFLYYLRQTNDLGMRMDDHLKRTSLRDASAGYSSTLAEALDCGLVKLTHFIQQHLPELAVVNMIAHPAYTRFRVKSRKTQSEALHRAITAAALDEKLSHPVLEFLDRMNASGPMFQQTFHRLAYFDSFLQVLAPLTELAVPARQGFLEEQLVRLNFNHLIFLQFLQQNIRRQLEGLKQDASVELLHNCLALYDKPPRRNSIYDQQWPGLCEMMTHWLKDVLQQMQAAASAKGKEKITLQTSVAHLACLLRVCHEEELPGVPLSEIFRWVSAHLATKRQTNISPGSLNKQFYTVSQFTAARVRERLLKLAARISLEYFPVMVAIGIATYVLPGMTAVLPAIDN